jgi:hypothetical protein
MVPMRNLLVLSAAASVLALVSTHQVAALSPGATASNPGALVHKTQKSDDTSGAQGQTGAQRGAEPGQRSEGGNRSSAGQDKGDRGSNMRSGDTNTRSGQKGTRNAQQRTNVDVNVGRGRHGQRDRAGRQTRVGVAVDNRHRSGRRDVDIGVSGSRSGRGYGYTSTGCQEILRRYRQCVAH